MNRKIDEASIDAALAHWPSTPRSNRAWEDTADRVLARLEGEPTHRSEPEPLLEAPLPKEEDEPESVDSRTGDVAARKSGSINPRPLETARAAEERAMMSSEERQRERSTFQNLAKMANTPAPPAPSYPPGGAPRSLSPDANSGIVDLKVLAALDPFRSLRSKTLPLAQSPARETPPVAPAPHDPMPSSDAGPAMFDGALPPPTYEAPSHVSPWGPSGVHGGTLNELVPEELDESALEEEPQSPEPSPRPGRNVSALLASARAQLAEPPPVAQEKKPNLVVIGTWGVAIVAAAAAVFFYVKGSPDAPAPTAAATTTESPAEAAPEKDKEPVVASADDLPIAPSPTSETKTKSVVAAKPAAPPVAAPRVTKAASTPAPEKAQEEKVAAAPKATATAKSGVSASDLANLTSEPESRPAPKQETADSTGSQAPGNMPLRPAPGEITTAVGKVLPNARACLSIDAPVSYATIVFESAGKVRSIAVTGGAEGKPAEGCIRSALGQIKLQPFFEPTFTARVTVRP